MSFPGFNVKEYSFNRSFTRKIYHISFMTKDNRTVQEFVSKGGGIATNDLDVTLLKYILQRLQMISIASIHVLVEGSISFHS